MLVFGIKTSFISDYNLNIHGNRLLNDILLKTTNKDKKEDCGNRDSVSLNKLSTVRGNIKNFSDESMITHIIKLTYGYLFDRHPQI